MRTCRMDSKRFLIIYLLLALLLNTASFKIGAFNLKVFGTKKSQNKVVLGYIVKIIRRYDVIFLQEIRDSSGESIGILEDAVNRGQNVKYGTVISARLGDSASKEQYMFFYRKDGVKVLSSYVYSDPQNVFEREPFIVKFKVPNSVIGEFVLAGIHVKPSAAIQEITALETVQKDIAYRTGNANILFLGDMNAECSYAPKYKLNAIPIRQSDKYYWLISDNIDTTVSSGTDCAYDRFIMYGNEFLSTVEEGSARVFQFDKEYGLTETQALTVSDHYPIELELKTVTNTAPYIPMTMFTSVCFGAAICSCFYCLRG